MNTILQILFTIILIISVIIGIGWYCVWGLIRLVAVGDKEIDHANKYLMKFKIFFVCAFVFLIMSIGCFVTGRNLDKQSCDLNEGIWEEWDAGFQWACYNPSLIRTENNTRVIYTKED